MGALSDGYPSWRRLLDLECVVGGLVSYAPNNSEDQLARGFEGWCEGSTEPLWKVLGHTQLSAVGLSLAQEREQKPQNDISSVA